MALRTRVIPVVLALGLLTPTVLARQAGAAPEAPPVAVAGEALDFTRVREGQGGVLTLELAAWTLTPVDPARPTVTLVGAVHVADKAFYEAMQALLDGHDVVLFEGVRPPGTGVVDPAADDAAKAEITARRQAFLLLASDRFFAERGRVPASWDELFEAAGPRGRSILVASTRDAWGAEMRLAAEGADDGAVRSSVRSAGPDGRFDSADDVRREGSPHRADAKAPRAAPPPNVQQQLAKALGLSFQLDVMDSSKPAWRNSDLAVDQVQAKLASAGADADWLFSMLDGKSVTSRLAGIMLGFVGSNPMMSATMKMMMVDLLAQADTMLASGPMARLGAVMKVIIDDRNEAVLADLRGIFANEPAVRRVAVFYGAGHMAHLVEGLRALGYTPGEVVWTPAISVDPKDAGMTPEQAQAMRQSMRGMLDAASRRPAK